MKFFIFVVLHVVLTQGQLSDLAPSLTSCRLSASNATTCLNRNIQAILSNSGSSPFVIDSLAFNLPPTTFLPIVGEVLLTNVRFFGFHAMRARSVSLNQANFARRGEFSVDITLGGPRLSAFATFGSNEFSGELQLMMSEYTFQVNMQARLLNSTNNDFQYIRLSSFKVTPTVREFNVKISNALPETYANVVLLAIEERDDISRENRDQFITWISDVSVNALNPFLANIPYQYIVTP